MEASIYTGTDFLIGENMDMCVCEVNTGLPGRAQEYDLIHRLLFNKPSGVFLKIEKISREKFGKPFRKYIRELPFFNDLKKLKIWMDGMGPYPENSSSYLRLEDKWVQYQVLSGTYPFIYTELFSKDSQVALNDAVSNRQGFILKRRLGRGGKGQIHVRNAKALNKLSKSELADDFYLYQPYFDSSITCSGKKFKLSIRALAFAGEFICMYANISERHTSNHGYLFYVNPSEDFGIKDGRFGYKQVNKKAWEAYIFYGKDTPGYLYHNLNEELVSDSLLNIPGYLHQRIVSISSSISNLYMGLDVSMLPSSYIEEKKRNNFPGFIEF